MLTPEKISELADIFNLLGDATRLSIVVACLDEPVSVSVLADSLGLSQPLVSHHLRLLKAARLVRADRHGKQIYYVAEDQHVRDIILDLAEHSNESLSENEN